jgi:hypothetical protein
MLGVVAVSLAFQGSRAAEADAFRMVVVENFYRVAGQAVTSVNSRFLWCG